MLQKSFVCLMTVAVAGIRIDAQETFHSAAWNGRNTSETHQKAGAFYKTAEGIFRGKLKQLNNKEIVIENDSKQMVSIRRSRQTKFFKNNQPTKPSDIDLETAVTVDAREAASVSLLAISVSVDSPPTKTGVGQTSPTGAYLRQRRWITKRVAGREKRVGC